jgi:glycerol-3-phosphate acyltransferase PlsX
MGGDHGAPVVVPAALEILRTEKNVRLILVGDQQKLTEELNKHGAKVGENLEIQHASQVVAMDELPSVALRSKKDSSMRVAINQVKEGYAQACVSAGNTGALMATARFVLKMLPGIDRPAICTALPTMKGHTHMLDLGANIDSTADSLFQYGMMGSILASVIDNVEKPTIGLLNIGEEEIKGSEYIKDAAKLLEQSDVNYYGFVEGDDIYKGTVDVVVCDGFVGNVALKTSEGVARMVKQFLKEAFLSGIRGKLAALVAKPVLKVFASRIDPGKYNGASLVGLQGIAVKSHGGADARAFANAIRVAIKEVKKNVPALIAKELDSMVDKRQVS